MTDDKRRASPAALPDPASRKDFPAMEDKEPRDEPVQTVPLTSPRLARAEARCRSK